MAVIMAGLFKFEKNWLREGHACTEISQERLTAKQGADNPDGSGMGDGENRGPNRIE